MLKKLYYLSLLTLILGQFSKIGLIGDVKIYLFDVIVGLYVLAGSFYFLISKYKFFISRYLILFYFFTFVAGLSLLANFSRLSSQEFLLTLFYLLRWVIYLQAANITYNLVKNKLIGRQEIYTSIVLSGLLVSLLGFLQLWVLPDFTVLDPSLGWDPHKNRLASTFFDPNFLGGYLVIVFTILLYVKNFSGSSKFIEKNRLKILLVVVLALFLTYSRSSWGMLSVIVLIYGLRKSKKLIPLFLIIVFLTYFAIPRIQTRISGITDPADSAHFRMISWSNALTISKDNIWTGVGFNAFKKSQIDYGFVTPDTVKEHSATGTDSSFLLVLATTGVVGMLFFVMAYFYPVFSSGNIMIVSMLLGLFLHTQFVNSLFYPQIMFVWLSLVSTADRLRIKS